MQRFWIRIFALAFGMGVVTGVVISYQLGLNWSGYARATADVLSPLFVLEVLTAFFLEAGFIGIMLFGEKKVGPTLHFCGLRDRGDWHGDLCLLDYFSQ
ncbi:MAG: cytochrome ubiquinol oxidase subunit I [Bradyrhizobium sp.]